ncbi:hypothetical protein V3468_05055 [Flavobacterium oreochromis]|uniref:Lipoprotein n=1 Tax=Flavobacterium oreochromis TaxID=2906078 RepID=A0ABW8P5A0_9FLAO|nr:hypothetical protein [Flavobacterium oreochromis]OWP75516.1 hypothetical protein BWG23_10760 [Flavobacterium oreochromis]
MKKLFYMAIGIAMVSCEKESLEKNITSKNELFKKENTLLFKKRIDTIMDKKEMIIETNLGDDLVPIKPPK